MSANNSSFISILRNTVKFSERLFRNTVSQGKWVFAQSEWAYTKSCNLYQRHVGEAPTGIVSAGIGIAIALITVLLFIPLFFWAIIKSI